MITDHACEEIAASLVAELEKTGCEYHAFILEELAPRPLVDMPETVLDDLAKSQVSIFAVQAQPNELKTRMQMCEVVNQHGLRHAHMVNIEKKIMLEGMRADFQQVDDLTLRVMNIVNKAQPDSCGESGRNRYSRRSHAGIPLDQNQWNHQPGQMGQSAGRRNVHGSSGGKRHIRRRWRGGRLPVCQVRRS